MKKISSNFFSTIFHLFQFSLIIPNNVTALTFSTSSTCAGSWLFPDGKNILIEATTNMYVSQLCSLGWNSHILKDTLLVQAC